MAIGNIKWFSEEKGYGFIEAESGPDVFVHYSVIPPDAGGWRTLQAGQYVEYAAEQTERGLCATSVAVIPIPAGSAR